ncbi:MAG: ATP-binding protein, partial [Anaerolineae bacterium]|nr:ATP-binding protein [Anaerolineae bacterium]
HILNNAIHYGKEGGSVFVVMQEIDKTLIVSIQDDGIGIAADVLHRIFEPFFRANEARTMDDRVGSGVGLAIVQRIVNLHGGEISVQSQPGQGTTVTVKLPLRQPGHKQSLRAS